PEVSISIVNRIANTSRLPVYIYDNAGIAVDPDNGIIGPENFSEMIKHPQIYGIKASSGDLSLFFQYAAIAEKAGRRAFVGNERMMAGSRSKDIVPSMANIYPELCKDLTDAPNREARMILQEELNKRGEMIYFDYKKIKGGLMQALACKGICFSEPLDPEQRLGPSEKRDIAMYVAMIEGRNPSA
ncbi:MAG: hypothetical protein KKE20_03845, partial [Nanoarchaeota archaeon]|nr:hypothetical protein [Nanoarchaeota archaeon]